MRPLLFIAIAIAGCDGGEAPPPTIEIPSGWKDVRRGTGHLAHLREDVKCKDCHAVEGSGFDRPSLVVCAKCHETVRDRSHRSEKAPKSDCYACHDFAEKTDVAKGACNRCHQEARTHAKEDCLACHAPHRDPPLAIDGCKKCHEEKRAFVHTKMSEVDGCTACHVGHERKQAALGTCAKCHADEQGEHRIGHECAACHPPHAPQPSCRSCHQNVRRDRHEDCSSCHQTANTCASCHGDVQVGHGKGDSDCASCHPPHRERKRCESCHAETTSHAKKLDCTSCHPPHQFERQLIRGEGCADSCHPKQSDAVLAGHRDCIDCHRTAPHAPERPPASCARCHEPQAKGAPKGHAACADCHEPHSGRVAKGCQSCHEQPVNIHTQAGDCSTCHAPHGPGPREPAKCGSCHPSPPELHRDPGHARCADCHRAHEPAPRKDQQAKRAASEASGDGSEGFARAGPVDRALCDGCHRLPNHEPKVETCVGCHPFR